MIDWEECKRKGLVKEIIIDEPLIKSLIESSGSKLESNDRLELDEVTASTKISIIYDSLREVLEALAIKKGFKIYNHECFCGFLSFVLNEDIFSKSFNKFRLIRNSINYYGRKISPSNTEILIREMIDLRKKLINKYLKKNEN